MTRTLCEPNWYFDRKGETSEGEEGWVRGSVFYLENDDDRSSLRVYARFDPMNETSLARFNSGPDARIPFLSDR